MMWSLRSCCMAQRRPATRRDPTMKLIRRSSTRAVTFSGLKSERDAGKGVVHPRLMLLPCWACARSVGTSDPRAFIVMSNLKPVSRSRPSWTATHQHQKKITVRTETLPWNGLPFSQIFKRTMAQAASRKRSSVLVQEFQNAVGNPSSFRVKRNSGRLDWMTILPISIDR